MMPCRESPTASASFYCLSQYLTVFAVTVAASTFDEIEDKKSDLNPSRNPRSSTTHCSDLLLQGPRKATLYSRMEYERTSNKKLGCFMVLNPKGTCTQIVHIWP